MVKPQRCNSAVVIFVGILLACSIIFGTVSVSSADDLGEHILAAILKNEKPSNAALLLLTRDLKWYEQNMGRLPEEIRSRVQQIRVNVAGDSAQMAARSLNEADSVFAATGSWKPGRDADILYLGKNGDAAASAIESGYDAVTGRILAQADNDPILKKFAGEVPKKLSSASLAVCTTELPNYGYRDLHNAYKKAKDALARGDSKEDIIRMLKEEVRQSMTKNVRAHFAAASNPDYYGGATGQEWFKKTYLDDPGRTRVFAQNADGQWVLQQGGIKALPDEIAERIGFGGLGGGQVKFTKIASDYSLFFSHMHGGPSDNAKYAMRVWKDMGLNAIQDLTEEELKVLVAAKAVSNNPARANQILAELGMSNVDDFNRGIANMLYRWTESQMMRDMDRIVAELGSASGRSLDDIERVLREAKGSMDLNEVVAGLNKLKTAPGGKELQAQLLEKLKAKFGNSNAGKAALQYILRNLGLLDDAGELTGRILRMLAKMGRVSKADLDAFEAGGELSEALKGQVGRAKKELIALNAGSMVSFDDTFDLERLMEDWRRSQPGALLQSPDDGLKKLLQEMKDAPDDELKKLGWLDEEIRIRSKIRASLRPDQQMMKSFGAKVQPRIVKAGGTLRQLQSKVRDLMFNPAYTKLGDPSISIGAFDAIVGVAAALYQSYDIMNGPAMSPADEALALENAWVTSIPIVGDFAQGLISGGQAYYEGDKGKALDAGLWVTVGIMGCVPGGQLPAVVTGIVLATKPIAAAAYEARQAQNLIQAWVESGIWTDTKPRELQGLFDRQGLRHQITYEWLLTDKANVPYFSEKFGTVTINDSIRDYAEKNVMPQYPSVKALRDALKSVYPDFSDKEWDDEFMVKIKIEARGGKGSKILFHSYNRVRTAALNQTVSHLKKWAEDEMRAAKDYSAEVARLRDELKKLEAELKTGNLVSNADASVEAYSRVVKNVWEQESLPLSKLRIYEHYVKTYSEVAGKLRRVADLLKEASSPYVPSSWHLTGYPEFDKGRVGKMLVMMEAGRKGIIEHIEFLLKDMGYQGARYDKGNECHKKVFDLLAPLRYKVAFIENLVEYYKQLAGGTSAWGSAYDTALKRYEESRDAALKSGNVNVKDLMGNRAMQDAFMTFVFALPYHLASTEATLYQDTSRDFELRQAGAQKDFDLAKGRGGKAGRELEACLVGDIKIEIQLSNPLPEQGEEVTATAKVAEGNLHKDVVWDWRFTGGLKKKEVRSDTATIVVKGRGRLTALLYDWYNPSTGKYGKVLKETSVDIAPKDAIALTLIISGPAETEAGKRATYYVSVSTNDPAAQDILARSHIEWRVNGTPAMGDDSSLSFVPGEPGSYTISAVAVTDTKSGKKTAGPAAQKGLLVKVPKKDDAKKPDDPKRPDDGTRPDGQPPADVKKAPPVCSYEYSAWGECNRGTKKQTRTVTAAKPGGCVEKNKPSLEQGCTPPPTEEELKARYYNCLCRCYCGWAGHIGVWWDPEGKSIPEAPSSGPCFGGAGAFGATRRHGFGAPNDCAKGCWEGAFGKGTYDSKKADEMRKAENRKHKKPLKVKLTASKNPADFGDIVTLRAEASEGIAGYTYTWGGCAQDAKDAQAKVVNARDCKPCTASVTVTDQDGESASDSVTIRCNALKVKLTKESPKENSVPIGGKATFRAEVFSGDKPASGSFTYIWERNPDVLFGDPKNPKYETTGGSTARNSASFRKPAATPVWVVVLREVEGRKMTVGESERIMIQVVKPKLTLKAEPQDPLVGQQVKITLIEEPKLDDQTVSYWWEIAGNTQNAGPERDQRIYTYKPKDDKPVTVTVHAKAKDGGEEIGVEKITISAKKPTVTVTGPKIAGPPPMIWKEGVGLVPADRQIAEGQRVEFAVAVAPAGAQQLRYRWTVTPEGCTLSAPSSKETGVTCGKTGSYTMTCEVKSADGADLGSGNAALSVTVSQSDISKGKQMGDARKRLDNAKQLWSQKKYDEAITEAEAASKIDPKLAAPVLARFSQELKKMGWDALNKADHQIAIKRLEQAVKLNPNDGDAKKKLQDAKAYASAWPRVEAKVKEFDALIAQKKIWSAQKTMLEMQDILRGLSAGQSSDNPVWKRVMGDFNKGMAWYNDFSQKSNAEWTRLFKAQDWEKAQVHIKQVMTNELSPADQKHYISALQTTQTMLGMKREVMLYYESAKANFAKGVPADVSGLIAVAKELRNKAGRLKEGDPGRAQMNDLAAAMDKKQKSLNTKAYARSFFGSGDQYYGAKNFEAAASKYAEGLKAIKDNGDVNDPDYAKYTKLRDDAMAKDKRFKELFAYAAGLAATDKPLGEDTIKKGIAAAEEGLKIRPRNGDMEIHWNKLKWKLGEAQRAKAQKQEAARKCDAKWTEGKVLYDGGKHPEALTKFRENIACAPGNKEREAYVRQFEDLLKKQAAAKQACLAVRQQGDALVQQKKYTEAVAKYRESLRCQPDPKLEEYIRQLEAEIRKQGDARASATRAKQLRDEGASLQKQNRIRDAIAKYKESLKYMPDAQLEAHIRKLETGLASTGGLSAGQAQPSAGSWSGSWKSDPGREGEVISFALSITGNRVTGTFSVVVPYTTSAGARKTDTLSGPLEGTVSGSRATGIFREAGDPKNTGTFEFVMAGGGSQFSCTVRANDGGESRTYTVRRAQGR